MRRYSTDVVVIGSGAAGMVAAVEARKAGAEVLMVGKGPTGKGTSTSLAGGVFSCASAELTPEAHFEATIAAGRGLNDARRVERVVSRAKERLGALAAAGVPLRPIPRGYAVDNRGNERLIPGVPLAEALAGWAGRAGVRTLPRFHGLELLQAEGRAAGVFGVSAEGEPVAICARAVVLAAGGASALYPRNDNPRAITGDGYALALRAGLELQDMEFVQFYPLGVAHRGLPAVLVYPPLHPAARLVDSSGRNVLEELEGCRDLSDAVVRFRDTASLLFDRVQRERGLYLDLSAVDAAAWASQHPLRLLARSGLDFRRERLGVAPITHFCMGGVVVDDRGATSLPGLFAAGEVTGGFHGANRLGGNALTECVVCGIAAGAGAAEAALSEGRRALAESALADLVPAWAGARKARVRPEYGRLEGELRSLASEYAGLVRTAPRLEEGLRRLSGIAAELALLAPRGPAEGLRENRLKSGLLVLRCVLEASLKRTESRGALYREDHPEADDGRWRRNIRISLDESTGELRLTDRQVA